MAMGTRKQREKQEGLWIAHTELASAPGHPFYQKLNELLTRFAVTCRRRNRKGCGTGRASRLSNKRCMQTSDECGASTARVYCGGAASSSSAASRTATRRAGCGAATFRGRIHQ